LFGEDLLEAKRTSSMGLPGKVNTIAELAKHHRHSPWSVKAAQKCGVCQRLSFNIDEERVILKLIDAP